MKKKSSDGLGEAMLAATDSILQSINDRLVENKKAGILDARTAKTLMKELVEELAMVEFRFRIDGWTMSEKTLSTHWKNAPNQRRSCRLAG